METENPRTGQGAGASISIASDIEASTRNHPFLQPDSARELQALRLIGTHHVRPELALTLATLAFGGAQ